MTSLAIVTATTDPERAKACMDSWGDLPIYVIVNGDDAQPYLGTVNAFRLGVREALAGGHDVIACLHDDLEIRDPAWAKTVTRYFDRHAKMGLAGFGGAIGLGALDMYQHPYDPHSLARVGFRSNMQDAEAHGFRSLLAERVACLDGFSQIGRAAFWRGQTTSGQRISDGPWDVLHDMGIVHHLYDGLLGAIAKRYGWETWYLPIACHHYGGRTAVGDPGYQRWADAQTQSTNGDRQFWEQAHKIGYERFRDVLPLRA